RTRRRRGRPKRDLDPSSDRSASRFFGTRVAEAALVIPQPGGPVRRDRGGDGTECVPSSPGGCQPDRRPSIGKQRTTTAPGNGTGPDRPGRAPALVLTVGHSARPLGEFLGLLQAHGVTLVVDVRKMPRSRRNPQFNRDALPASLREAGIGYVDLPGLGGL